MQLFPKYFLSGFSNHEFHNVLIFAHLSSYVAALAIGPKSGSRGLCVSRAYSGRGGGKVGCCSPPDFEGQFLPPHPAFPKGTQKRRKGGGEGKISKNCFVLSQLTLM